MLHSARPGFFPDSARRFPAPPAGDSRAKIDQRTRHKHQQVGQKQRHFGLIDGPGIVNGHRNQRQRGHDTRQRTGHVIAPFKQTKQTMRIANPQPGDGDAAGGRQQRPAGPSMSVWRRESHRSAFIQFSRPPNHSQRHSTISGTPSASSTSAQQRLRREGRHHVHLFAFLLPRGPGANTGIARFAPGDAPAAGTPQHSASTPASIFAAGPLNVDWNWS